MALTTAYSQSPAYPDSAIWQDVIQSGSQFPLVKGSSSINIDSSGNIVLTSTASSGLAVGPNGSTNPVLRVDCSVASEATGITVTGAAAGSGVAVAARSSGTNEDISVNAKGSGHVTLGNTGTGTVRIGQAATGAEISGVVWVTNSNANALAVGPNGTTNPTLQVDASTASAATGIKVVGAAAAAGVAVAVISSGTDEALTVDAKGAGTLTLNGTATGVVTTPRVAVVKSGTGATAGGVEALRIGSGGTGVVGVYYGSGAPSASAPKGSLYLRTDGSTTTSRAYINTDGSTTWTAITTSA